MCFKDWYALGTQVFTFGWWGGQYGGQSPKRHRGFTNNVWASKLDLGVYKRHEQAKKRLKTVRRYVSKTGKPAYVGTRSLKGTQPGPQQFVVYHGQWCIVWYQMQEHFSCIYFNLGYTYMSIYMSCESIYIPSKYGKPCKNNQHIFFHAHIFLYAW